MTALADSASAMAIPTATPIPYSPYGYSTLNSPYGYSTMNGGVTAFPGTVTAPGVTTTPVPNGTSTTILPSFPYMGSVGGQATVGGY